MARTVFGMAQPFLRFLQKGVDQGAARQPHRAGDDPDVLFLTVHVGLFERRVSVAFLRGHKPGGHLHAGRSAIQHIRNVLSGEYAASGDDGNGLSRFFSDA